jgi:prevent-host-death family protein
MVMTETLPLVSVRARLSELVDRVARQQDRVVVTRNGELAAVLVRPDDLERLEGTLAVMSRPIADGTDPSEREIGCTR